MLDEHYIVPGKGVDGTTSEKTINIDLLRSYEQEVLWDGKAWHMTTSSTVDLSNVQSGSAKTDIYQNGTLVQNVNPLAARIH